MEKQSNTYVPYPLRMFYATIIVPSFHFRFAVLREIYVYTSGVLLRGEQPQNESNRAVRVRIDED